MLNLEKDSVVYLGKSAPSSGGGSYTLPPATTETLGGIKVGQNLTVEEDGTLNATGGDVSNKANANLDNLVEDAKLPLTDNLADIYKTVPYTVVGSPTITNGVVSGFSADDGIKVPNFPALTADWEITVQGSLTSTTGQSRLIILDGMYLRSINGEWNIHFTNGDEPFCGTVATYPFIRIKKENNKASVYRSTNGKDFTLAKDNIDIGDSLTDTGDILFGQDSLYWNGTLNLYNTNVKVNGKYFFLGRGMEVKPAHLAMPSGTYDTLTAGSSGDEYTAPADGYFYGCCGGSVMFTDMDNEMSMSANSGGVGGGQTFLPVTKGHKVKFFYSTSSYLLLRFVYANGTKNEQQGA